MDRWMDDGWMMDGWMDGWIHICPSVSILQDMMQLQATKSFIEEKDMKIWNL